jgi:hypothetical protein
MEKENGRRILKRLQACVSYRNDEDAAAVLVMVRDIALEELAKLEPVTAEPRAEHAGHDRQRKGGRDRALI